MAVTKPVPKIRDFWPNFFKRTLVIVILMQLGIAILIGGLLVITGTFELTEMWLWIVIASVFGLGTIVSIATLAIAGHPAKDLLAAVIHISGEPTNLTPPNPNEKKYAHNGFKDALQAIYELSSGNRTMPAVEQTNDSAPAVDNSSLLASALDNTTCGFVGLDSKHAIMFANKAAPINISSDGVKSLKLMFNGSDTLDVWLEACEQNSVHAERIWTRIADRLPSEEGRRLFDVIASYQKGAATETVLTLVDRTEIYTVDEEDLDFIAFAAHELRGPITVIRGYLDVLEDELSGVLQDDQHELFRRLTVSANRLSGYINNILNTSRYDRRHLNVHLAEDSLSSIYDTISDDMQLRASSQSRLLSVQIPADLPTIAADRTSLGEVIGNLIDNAIKYSNEGGAINVTAEAKGEFVELSIEDHGIGMPGNVMSNLFQKFYRSHRSRETVAGTGIGLYISKGIIESHGGRIGVRSEEGKGSTFTVSIPIYATVADKLKAGNNSNEGLIEQGVGWIKNHSMYRS